MVDTPKTECDSRKKKHDDLLGYIGISTLFRPHFLDVWGSTSCSVPYLQDDELSYALGKQGGTRKKLERASGENFGMDIDVP